jgi:hypothetical protein
MNLEQIKALSDEELNDEVLKLVGYIEHRDGEHHKYELGHYWTLNGSLVKGKIPDFVHDLNAMHEVELDIMNMGDEWGRYTDILLDIIVKSQGYQAAELLVHASARQRAEAFVLIMTMEKIQTLELPKSVIEMSKALEDAKKCIENSVRIQKKLM